MPAQLNKGNRKHRDIVLLAEGLGSGGDLFSWLTGEGGGAIEAQEVALGGARFDDAVGSRTMRVRPSCLTFKSLDGARPSGREATFVSPLHRCTARCGRRWRRETFRQQ